MVRHMAMTPIYFNPRSRMGSDLGVGHDEPGILISIHAPAWGATTALQRSFINILFQSTLPHGERPTSVRCVSPFLGFQSTLPHGERHNSAPYRLSHGRFQSTLPHGERHDRPHFGHPHLVISIHAPAWERLLAAYAFGVLVEFQSTLPHGERLHDRRELIVVEHISIHAPAWGATPYAAALGNVYEFQSTLPHGERQTPSGMVTSRSIFQSTLPHGERPQSLSSWLNSHDIFQSTLPHGERQLSWETYKQFHDFNPRSRMGSDFSWRGLPPTVDISIHAPAWGATHKKQAQKLQRKFQSTLPHGERPASR